MAATGNHFLPSCEPAQTTGIEFDPVRRLLRRWRRGNCLNIVNTKAQQRGNVADLVELGIVFHVEQFNVAANDPGQNRLAHVDHFLRGPAADGAEAHQMRLDVSTAGTLDRLGEKILDRKSTRLNSSHQIISYAVFCLKKKKKQ